MNRCSLCLSDNIERISENLCICRECGHTFSDLDVKPEKNFLLKEKTLIINSYSVNELFHSIPMQCVNEIFAQNYIEYVSNPQAHIYDLHRMLEKGGYGVIKVSKGNFRINYFSRKKICDMFIRAGFKVENTGFWSQMKSIFRKEIIIKFRK